MWARTRFGSKIQKCNKKDWLFDIWQKRSENFWVDWKDAAAGQEINSLKHVIFDVKKTVFSIVFNIWTISNQLVMLMLINNKFYTEHVESSHKKAS